MEVALLEHQAIVLERKHRSIRAHINTLLNKLPDGMIDSPAVLSQIESLPDLKSLQDKALLIRPELKALTAHVESAKSQSELAVKNN